MKTMFAFYMYLFKIKSMYPRLKKNMFNVTAIFINLANLCSKSAFIPKNYNCVLDV